MSTRYERLQERVDEIASNDQSGRGGSSNGNSESRLSTAVASADPRNVVSSIQSNVASLVGASDMDPDPEAFARSSTEIYSTSVDVDRPLAETEDYWTEYEQNPIIATQIDGLCVEVFEGGYWVTADSSETEEEMVEFLENMALEAGQTHRPFTELGKQAVRQYLVRGTYLGEKMMEDGRHVGINPVNPTTVEIYTKPGTNVLVPPTHSPTNSDTMVKATDDGEVAAYVQFDEQFSSWNDRAERRFARDEILHWARNPDIGDTRGNSVVQPVYQRSRALREKFQDNDLAISMKAWPMILFQTGTPENPWTLDEMKTFMSNYEEGNLGPGSFQAVPGDIDVYEFAGETADIHNHIQADVDFIVSGLPGAKYSLGAFTEGSETVPSKSVSGAHERRTRKLIRTMRNDLENLFTPYLRDVAESWGYDPSGLELNIGRPDGDVAPEDIQGNIIRYQSDVHNDNDLDEPNAEIGGQREMDSGEDESTGEDSTDGGDSESGESEEEASTQREPVSGRTLPESAVATLADPSPIDAEDADTASLADPRLVATSDVEEDLGEDVLGEALIETRDRLIDLLEIRFGDQGVPDARSVRDEFSSLLGNELSDRELRTTVETAVRDVRERTLETLEQDTHNPGLTGESRAQYELYVDSVVQTLIDDTRSFGDELGETFARQATYADENSHGAGTVSTDELVERVRTEFTDEMLVQRSQLIARMNLQRLVNRCKIHAYRNAPGVVGVELVSRCADTTHWLTADLAACDGGEPARAFFDDGSIGSQFQDQLSRDPPPGFDPLPNVPPFHFGDTAEFVPVVADNSNTPDN